MVAYTTHTFIDRPPERVFPYIADPRHHTSWMDLKEARSVEDGPTQVGSRVAGVIAKGPIRLNIEWEVTELDPNRRYAYQTTRGPMEWSGMFTIDPEGTGSRVASSGTVEFRGPLRVLQPLLASEVRRGEASELVRLKQLVESGRV